MSQLRLYTLAKAKINIFYLNLDLKIVKVAKDVFDFVIHLKPVFLNL